jgi:hypothetical protein
MYLDVTCYQPVYTKEKRSTYLNGDEEHGEITSSPLTESTLLRKQMSREGDQVGCWGFQLGRWVGVGHFDEALWVLTKVD